MNNSINDNELDSLLQLVIVQELKKILVPIEPTEINDGNDDKKKPAESDEIEDNSDAIDSITEDVDVIKTKGDSETENKTIKEWLKEALGKLIDFFKEIPSKIKTMIDNINEKIQKFRGIKFQAAKGIKITIKSIGNNGELIEKDINVNMQSALSMLQSLGRSILKVGQSLSQIFRKTTQSAKEGINNSNNNIEAAKENKKDFLKGQKEMSKRFSLIGSYYRACSSIFQYLANNAKNDMINAENEENKTREKLSNNKPSMNNLMNNAKATANSLKTQTKYNTLQNKANAYNLKATQKGM